MAEIVLYHRVGSPPSWSVRMLAEILGVTLQLKDIDIPNKQHKSDAYRKLNPMGTVPTMHDGDFVISESHTINKYLLEKYGNEEQKKMYPKGLKQQAYVDQVMFFDTGVAFIRLKDIGLPAIFGNDTELAAKSISPIEDVYKTVELYLDGREYVAASEFTLADISLGATITSLNAFHKVDSTSYPQTSAWLARLHSLPYFENIAVYGAEVLSSFIRGFWEKNKSK